MAIVKSAIPRRDLPGELGAEGLNQPHEPQLHIGTCSQLRPTPRTLNNNAQRIWHNDSPTRSAGHRGDHPSLYCIRIFPTRNSSSTKQPLHATSISDPCIQQRAVFGHIYHSAVVWTVRRGLGLGTRSISFFRALPDVNNRHFTLACLHLHLFCNHRNHPHFTSVRRWSLMSDSS